MVTTFKHFPKPPQVQQNAKGMPKTCFIIPYFGKLPVWLPLFLESCKKNPSFSWFLFSDQQGWGKLPKNVKLTKMSLNDFNMLARKQTGLPFSIKTPYKICDAKPIYGEIFKDYLKGYGFWGVSDLDVIYGDLEAFGIRAKLKNCDIYSPFSSPVGHFTLFRNTTPVNELYLNFENLQLAYRDGPTPLGFDERRLDKAIATSKLRFVNVIYKNELLKNCCEAGASIMPSGQLVGERLTAQERYLWENGKTFQLNGKLRREFLYLHFFCWKNSAFWKRYLANSSPGKFWLDLGGYTANQKDLLATDNLSRLFRFVVRFTNLVIRAKKRLLF